LWLRRSEVIEEVTVHVEEIRKEKKEKKLKTGNRDTNYPIRDRVRMLDGKPGTIDAIEKNKATVNYGAFYPKVSLDSLELVEAINKKK
jgi:DNA mismatch repair protein MutS2